MDVIDARQLAGGKLGPDRVLPAGQPVHRRIDAAGGRPSDAMSSPSVTSAHQVSMASSEAGGHPGDDQGPAPGPAAGREAGQPPYICARTWNSHGCRIHRMFFMARVNESNGRRSGRVSRRGESHPPPLSGPDVTISRHPAPAVRP